MILTNKYLRVEIAALGAELMSIYDRSAGTELLWNGDPAYWKRRSPILFPNVGKTWQNVMRIDGAVYPTSQHGFARDRDFVCESSDDVSATWLLRSDEKTLERYPYDFELRIRYALEGRSLRVTWIVDNPNDREMAFTIGGHPAFCFERAEDSKDGYALRFPDADALHYILLDPASGTARPEDAHALVLADGMLPLSDELFTRDAMIFDGGQIDEVWLCGSDGAPRVGMRCPGFPNFGIWSVVGAPFVCLEPWAGRCDDSGFEGELRDKPNVNLLPAGGHFERSYEILLPKT